METDKLKLPHHLNRRKKLTQQQKDVMREKYKQGGTSYNELAREYGVSKRTAIFAVNPEKYELAKEQRRKRWAAGKYREHYKKEAHRKAMQSIRARKKRFHRNAS